MARPAIYDGTCRVTIVMSRKTQAQLRKIAKEKGMTFSRLCAILLSNFAEKRA